MNNKFYINKLMYTNSYIQIHTYEIVLKNTFTHKLHVNLCVNLYNIN
jgi:hypothetical protein